MVKYKPRRIVNIKPIQRIKCQRRFIDGRDCLGDNFINRKSPAYFMGRTICQRCSRSLHAAKPTALRIMFSKIE